MGGAAGIRAVRGSVPDQVRLRGRPAAPQRAEDPAHDALSAGLFFITPALENLDVASQGLNTRHSFLYKAHGMLGSATVARFAARGWGLYAVGIGLTAARGMLYLTLRGLLLIDAWPGDVMQQHCFCFLRIDCIITPPRGLLNQRTARHSPRLSIPCPCHDTPPFT